MPPIRVSIANGDLRYFEILRTINKRNIIGQNPVEITKIKD